MKPKDKEYEFILSRAQKRDPYGKKKYDKDKALLNTAAETSPRRAR